MFLFAIGYSRFLSQQADTANKIGKKQKLREFATALATLAVHKLKYSAQLTTGGETRRAWPAPTSSLAPLYDYIAQPLIKFESEKHFPMQLD